MDHDDLLHIAEAEKSRAKPVQLRCCTSSGCRASGALDLLKHLHDEVDQRGLADRVDVVGVGCPGLCSQGPIVQTVPDGSMFGPVALGQAGGIASAIAGGSSDARRSGLLECEARSGDRASRFASRSELSGCRPSRLRLPRRDPRRCGFPWRRPPQGRSSRDQPSRRTTRRRQT